MNTSRWTMPAVYGRLHHLGQLAVVERIHALLAQQMTLSISQLFLALMPAIRAQSLIPVLYEVAEKMSFWRVVVSSVCVSRDAIVQIPQGVLRPCAAVEHGGGSGGCHEVGGGRRDEMSEGGERMREGMRVDIKT